MYHGPGRGGYTVEQVPDLLERRYRPMGVSTTLAMECALEMRRSSINKALQATEEKDRAG